MIILGAFLFVHADTSADTSAASTLELTWSDDGKYVFPLAGPVHLMAWERFHWDGSDEVDIFAAPQLPHGSRGLARFERSPVVAVTHGVVRRVDNERGGIAIRLVGHDGRHYYYAHLSESTVSISEGGRRVRAGERLGTIGRTGRWSRYIETHLHFSVSARSDPSILINAADWFYRMFGLESFEIDWPEYPPDGPSVSVAPEGFRVIRNFDQNQRENRDTASVDAIIHGAVVSPFTGEVRVMRNTALGLRVQVTNRHTDQTVVVSGIRDLQVQTGDLVRAGSKLGYAGDVVNVMYFDRGVLRDPLSVVLVPAEETDHSSKEER